MWNEGRGGASQVEIRNVKKTETFFALDHSEKEEVCVNGREKSKRKQERERERESKREIEYVCVCVCA